MRQSHRCSGLTLLLGSSDMCLTVQGKRTDGPPCIGEKIRISAA